LHPRPGFAKVESLAAWAILSPPQQEKEPQQEQNRQEEGAENAPK
jgi:hypothetical protein